MAHENNHTGEHFIRWGVSSASLWKGPNVLCIKRRYPVFAGWWSHRNRHKQHQFIGRPTAAHSNRSGTLFVGKRCHNGNLWSGRNATKMIKITQNIMILLWDNFICCQMTSHIYERIINVNRCHFYLFSFSIFSSCRICTHIKLFLCSLDNAVIQKKNWIEMLTHGVMTMLLRPLMMTDTHEYNRNYHNN